MPKSSYKNDSPVLYDVRDLYQLAAFETVRHGFVGPAWSPADLIGWNW